MKGLPRQVVWIAALALLCATGLGGCARAGSDARDARDRRLRRALEAKAAQDIDRAIALCEQALARKPDLALAHRELGLMLDNYRGDYVGALYHYRRYLELRPGAPQRAAIEELIRHCRVSFAAQMAESPEELKRDLQVRDARIRQLELEVAAWRARGGTAAGSPAIAPAVPPPVKNEPAAVPPAPAAPAVRTHIVQPGETLATISARYYGTPAKWQTLFDANRDTLANANNLRVGARLTIPAE